MAPDKRGEVGDVFVTDLHAVPSQPELTNWPSGTHNGTEHERHAAFLNGSGGMRSGLNPLWFSDASCRATQM